jgi:hypothetical protein
VRLASIAILTALLAGPWAGCDRDPVTPPAAPPPERAPVRTSPAEEPNGTVLLAPHRRLT